MIDLTTMGFMYFLILISFICGFMLGSIRSAEVVSKDLPPQPPVPPPPPVKEEKKDSLLNVKPVVIVKRPTAEDLERKRNPLKTQTEDAMRETLKQIPELNEQEYYDE